MTPHRLYVGTIGQGVFRSVDHGGSFVRASPDTFVECDVRALAVDPADGRTIYLGSEEGLFRSRDGADTWQQVFAPPDREAVWCVALTPGRIAVGTCPSRVFISEDDGKTWTMARTKMTQECPRIRHTRITSLLVDPDDPKHLWAGVEIDGIHESDDGGRSFRRVGTGLTSADIHALAVAPSTNGRRFLATTNRDLNVSADGLAWHGVGIDGSLPWLYCRALVAVRGAPRSLLLGNGTGPPGWEGTIGRSTDGGETWAEAKMPARANSTIWAFALHDADPRLIYAASVSGQVLRSLDGGASWERLAKEFGEIRALAWAPA